MKVFKKGKKITTLRELKDELIDPESNFKVNPALNLDDSIASIDVKTELDRRDIKYHETPEGIKIVDPIFEKVGDTGVLLTCSEVGLTFEFDRFPAYHQNEYFAKRVLRVVLEDHDFPKMSLGHDVEPDDEKQTGPGADPGTIKGGLKK